MLDMKFVREHTAEVVQAMKNRNMDMNLDEFSALEQKRREILQQVEADKSKRNAASAEISKMKKAGENADAQIAAMRALGDEIAKSDKELKDVQDKLQAILYNIPNMPAADVPLGKGDQDNPVVRTWSEPTKFSFKPLNHWDIGENLNIWTLKELPRFPVLVSPSIEA